MRCLMLLSTITMLLAPLNAAAQPGEKNESPILKIKTFGPSAYVSQLAFSPDGKTLYASGWDKVIRVWQLNEESREFEYQPDRFLRVPIGPGLYGGINSITLSADGRWLAVAGRWPMRGRLNRFSSPNAWVLPSAALTEEQRLDSGNIYVFDTHTRTALVLRGHNAPVVAMEFLADKEKLTLVSTADRVIDREVTGAVHVWDVLAEQEKLIAKLESTPVPGRRGIPPKWLPLPRPPGQRPGLAIWRTGAGPKDLRVALAWGEKVGLFRVWDVRTRQIATSVMGSYPLVVNTLTGNANGQRLFFGAHSELGIWEVPAGARGVLGALNRQQNFTSLTDLGIGNLPVRATLFATRPGGSLNAVAVIIQHQSTPNAARLELQLIGLNGQRLLGKRMLIQAGTPSELSIPSIATTRRSGYLAVSGGKNNTIRLYQIQKLLAGDSRNPQILRGAGTSWQKVAFVKNGNSLGLQLQTTAAGQASSLTFDITNRIIVKNPPAGWQPTEKLQQRTPSVERILRSVTAAPAGIRQPVITAFAVAPAGKPAPVQLVAVASHHGGEPFLRLYDAGTGEKLREFVGHLERIRDLAFSDDGRLLASVADDHTVRVWWVADITDTLDKLGYVAGLLVKELGNPVRLVVDHVEDGKRVAEILKKGDVIVSAKTNNGQATFNNRWDFYEFLTGFAPKNTVSLLISRAGRQREVELVTDQGVDRKNPLFSLFLNPEPEDGPNAFSWIGWNPIGPYDRFNVDSERYLGWHFNTGDPKSPTRFASAGEYRKQNYSLGLLKRLIEMGPSGVVVVDQDKKFPPLKMTVVIVSDRGKTYSDIYVEPTIREDNLTAQITIDGDFPLDRLGPIPWKLDGDQQETPLQAAEQAIRIFQANLTALKRGKHTLTVEPVTTDKLNPQSKREMTFFFFPPPPEIKFDEKSLLPKMTTEPTVTLEATVGNVEFAGPVAVELVLNDKQMKTWTIDAGETLKIDEVIMLAVGKKNSITLKAHNTGALKNAQVSEANSVTNWVDCKPTSGPPSITIAQILSRDDGTKLNIKPAPAPKGKKVSRWSVVTDVPYIRIQGKVTAPDPLTDLSFILAPAERGKSPAKFVAKKFKRFDFDEKISVRPGKQTLTIRAETMGNKQAADVGTVVYLPLLPLVTNVAVQAGPGAKPRSLETGKDVNLNRDSDPQMVTLLVRIEQSQDPHPAQAQLEINGKAVGQPLDITPKTTALKQQVKLLNTQTNVIRFKITSKWRTAGKTVMGGTIYYLRPPVIARVDPKPNEKGQLPDQTGKPYFDFTAKVTSDVDLLLLSFDVAINGTAVAEDDISFKQNQANKSAWTATVHQAPLKQGLNRIRLLARNADGKSQPVEFTVQQLAPPANPPQILLGSPADDDKVSSNEISVKFKVRSKGKLSRVDLVITRPNDTTERRIDMKNSAVATGEANLFQFSKQVRLSLGMNLLSIEAKNAGGLTHTGKLFINVVPPPITIVLDKIVPQKKTNGPIVKPITRKRFQADGVHFVNPAPGGHVTIHGHADWTIGANARKKIADSNFIRVWVNGFLRIVKLSPVANNPKRATFKLPVVLNRKKNRIDFEHTAIPNPDDKRKYYVKCNKPELGQRLHIVMFGIRKIANGPPITATIINRNAKEALLLGGKINDFARRNTTQYPTLAGPRAQNKFIKARLRGVANSINSRARRARLNDVVLIYYHGLEFSAKDGRLLLADSRNRENPEADGSAISSSYLSKMLNNHIPGAHLLLLDVNHVGKDVGLRWPRNPHLGIIRISISDQVRLFIELVNTRPNVRVPEKDILLRHIELALKEGVGKMPELSLYLHVPDTHKDLVLGREN